MSNGYYGSYIVPVDDETRAGPYDPPIGRIPIYDPWTILISQGIEAARSAAERIEGPRYPQYPTPPLAPPPLPPPPLGRQPRPPGQDITLSTNTLMLLVGGVLLFMLGGRRK